MIFQTKINGIPCSCKVVHYMAGQPDKVTGPMEDAELGWDEEFEFVMLDHSNILAPWLDKQVTPEDRERLLEEFHITNLEIKHGYS